MSEIQNTSAPRFSSMHLWSRVYNGMFLSQEPSAIDTCYLLLVVTCWVEFQQGFRCAPQHRWSRFPHFSSYFSTSTTHLYNICTTPAQRLRRWPNIVQMLYKCLVFAGLLFKKCIRRREAKTPRESRKCDVPTCVRKLRIRCGASSHVSRGAPQNGGEPVDNCLIETTPRDTNPSIIGPLGAPSAEMALAFTELPGFPWSCR